MSIIDFLLLHWKIVAIIFGIWLISYLIKRYVYNPFTLPIIEIRLDITGRKKPSYIDCIEQFILDHPDYNIQKDYDVKLNEWDINSQRLLRRFFLFKKHHKEQYLETKEKAYSPYYEIWNWVFFRQQTRYQQINYQKHPYVVENVEHVSEYTLKKMLELREGLEKTGFELTTEKFFAKDQRRLMTRELREEIMKRDNYTCQKCGKYMPDEVGLEVDHIIPIKKGGKSIRSNLQVLCDNCNSKKRARIE